MLRQHAPHTNLAKQGFQIRSEAMQHGHKVLLIEGRVNFFVEPLERLLILVVQEADGDRHEVR